MTFKSLILKASSQNYGDLMDRLEATDLRIIIKKIGEGIDKQDHDFDRNEVQNDLIQLIEFYESPLSNVRKIFEVKIQLEKKYNIKVKL